MVAGRVPVLLGPTAVGKTAVGLALAAHWPIEIVSADSRQIYRGLDIGTAKPTRKEQMRAPHHGLDVVDVGRRYSAGHFARDAARCLGAADSWLPEGHRANLMERTTRARAEERIRRVLDEAAFEAAYAEGGGLGVEEATALMLRER